MIICHQVPEPGTAVYTLCRSCGHVMLMHSGLGAPCGVCSILAAAETLSIELLPVIHETMKARQGVSPWIEPSARPDNAVDVTGFGSLEPEWVPGGALIATSPTTGPQLSEAAKYWRDRYQVRAQSAPEPVLDMTPAYGGTIYRVGDQEVSREEFERVATGSQEVIHDEGSVPPGSA